MNAYSRFATARCADDIDSIGCSVTAKLPIAESGRTRTLQRQILKDITAMTQHQIDSKTLRAELRALPRGSLEASSPEEFARAVDEAIAKFAEHERPRYMDEAHKAANDAQRIAMRSK